MLNKIIVAVSVGLVGFTIFSYVGLSHQKETLNQVMQQKQKLVKTNQTLSANVTQLTLEKNSQQFNAKDAMASFVKCYYTFSNQSDYNKRQGQLASILDLPSDEQTKLFKSDLDDSGSSIIANLGLISDLEKVGIYTIDGKDNQIEVYAIATVTTKSKGQSSQEKALLVKGIFNSTTNQFTNISINQVNY